MSEWIRSCFLGLAGLVLGYSLSHLLTLAWRQRRGRRNLRRLEEMLDAGGVPPTKWIPQRRRVVPHTVFLRRVVVPAKGMAHVSIDVHELFRPQSLAVACAPTSADVEIVSVLFANREQLREGSMPAGLYEWEDKDVHFGTVQQHERILMSVMNHNEHPVSFTGQLRGHSLGLLGESEQHTNYKEMN